MIGWTAKALTEAASLARAPQRVVPLIQRLAQDKVRVTFERRHLYSYATTTRLTSETLGFLIRWLLDAQRADGGIAAYYSLLKGYSDSYPEVTGYIIPTLFDYSHSEYSHSTKDETATVAADRAIHWLLSLQMPAGAFPGGLHGSSSDVQPSVFNTGQILHG